ELVADAGLGQDRFPCPPRQDGIQADDESVQLVRPRALLPENLGDDAEEISAIEKIRSIADDGEVESAQSHRTTHGAGASSNSRLKWSRIKLKRWSRATGPEMLCNLRGYSIRSNCLPASMSACVIWMVFCMCTLSSPVPCA